MNPLNASAILSKIVTKKTLIPLYILKSLTNLSRVLKTPIVSNQILAKILVSVIYLSLIIKSYLGLQRSTSQVRYKYILSLKYKFAINFSSLIVLSVIYSLLLNSLLRNFFGSLFNNKNKLLFNNVNNLFTNLAINSNSWPVKKLVKLIVASQKTIAKKPS